MSDSIMFTGQYYDSEISQYYLRARQYDPILMRFTSYDPLNGKYKRPLTFHKYLYCYNDPINKIDPSGRLAFLFGASFSGNITGSDLGGAFIGTKGIGGIGSLVAYYSILMPVAIMTSNHFGLGITFGASFVAAWDNTKKFNDKSAWSWATMRWTAAGASVSSGVGVSGGVDLGISNARHVSQLAGRFVEGGGSVSLPSYWNIGGTLSWGVNEDGSFNNIWLGTLTIGCGTPGWEGHTYAGYAEVTEFEF